MKILRIFFLLGVTCFADSIGQQLDLNKSVMGAKNKSVTDLQVLAICKRPQTPIDLKRCASELDFTIGNASVPHELLVKILEFVADEPTLEKAKANMKALARTCKTFWFLHNDQNLNRKIIQTFDLRLPKERDEIRYWRLYSIAAGLHNLGALAWFASQKIDNMGLRHPKQMDSAQRTALKNALIRLAGGLTVSEYKLLDLQPVKVLEYQEHVPNQPNQNTPPPVKILKLSSCSLRNLAGIECTQDLNTVEILSISGNYITTFDLNVFNRFERLTRIDCAQNELQSVNLNMFARFPRLQSLDFYSNKIEEVKCDEQFKSTELQTVSFNTNNIKYIDPKVLARIPSRLIDLRGNPLQNKDEIRALSRPVTNRILVDGD